MNFFKHHIGDYASATDHLSWDEDMAYTRLLRVYYRDEHPLPAEVPKVYRLVRAQSRKERTAVDTVLGEFFIKHPDGWHNKRCDEEVAQAQTQAEVNRKIAANRTRTVNGSLPAQVNDSSTKRTPLQTPDSNIQTPLSNIHTPSPTPPSEGGAVRGGKKAWKPPQLDEDGCTIREDTPHV
jgi:uncharacterized protein YdaU (DUF1376 family)